MLGKGARATSPEPRSAEHAFRRFSDSVCPFFRLILPGSFETHMDFLGHDHSKAAGNIREPAQGEIPVTFANFSRKSGSVARVIQDGVHGLSPLTIGSSQPPGGVTAAACAGPQVRGS
jgi:hypothetical protein